MGILAWGAFGKGGAGFPWGLLAFCACFGIGDECFQDWMGNARILMCGMRRRMRWVRLLVCCSRWFSGRDRGIIFLFFYITLARCRGFGKGFFHE